MQQLILNLTLPITATFGNYIEGANANVVNLLVTTFFQRQEPYVYLWGGRSTGKTHLLHACCNKVTAEGEKAFYVDLTSYEIKSDILTNLEHYDLICLDNISAIQGNNDWEEKLFYFYNRCRENNTRLLISSTTAPANLNLILADLKSRLSGGLILHLEELTDNQKRIGLQQHARNKGFQLSDEVVHYILSRYSRDMEKLIQLLNHIDKQSLIEKRRVTIPFLKTILYS